MKKIVILSLSLFFILQAHAVDMNDCLTESESFGNHVHSITPNATCFDLLNAESAKVVATSADSVWKAYAYKHMLYLEKYSGATLLSRELLAGDQTQLKDIQSIQFESAQNKLLLLQLGEDGTEYLSFNLDFIGNVSPKSFLAHSVANGAQSVSWSANGEEVSLHFPEGIKVYSSSADSRFQSQGDQFKVQLIRTEAL